MALYWKTTRVLGNMFGILVFGDSLIVGRGETPSYSWVKFFKKMHEKEFYDAVYSLGIFGNTTTELLERFEAEAKVRIKLLRKNDRFIVVFAIGTNDARCTDEKGTPKTTPENFERNIKELFEKARKHTKEIILLGVPPVDEKRTQPYEKIWFTNEQQSKYNNILRRIAQEENIPFYGYDEFWNSWTSEDFADGVHPNTQGYKKMWEGLEKFFQKTIIR